VKRIFVDIYLQFNLGDDLFLDILAKRYPNCQFTINYLGKYYDKFISKYPNVNKRDYNFFHKIGQRLKIKDSITNYDEVAKEHDGLLFLGGSIFMEADYHNDLYKDRLKMVNEFTERNKPVFILGANFGPYKTKKFYDDYKYLFSLCTDVCFRDLYSYNLFKNLEQVRYAPDIVFGLDITDYKSNDKEKKIGYSIINVKHKKDLASCYDEYIYHTVLSIENFVSKGYQCCLMSFCKVEGDLKIIDEIKDKLKDKTLKNVTVYDYQGNLKEVISLIASFKLFVAARFHANILGLLFKTGIMPVIYSDKTTNVLNDIKFNKVYVRMSELFLQYDEETINKSLSNIVELEGVVYQSEGHFQQLAIFLNNGDDQRGII
jgi:colanic acid/amylovoran biosynthesis protein